MNPLAPLQKYADFEGRASRSEYWLYTLCHLVITGVLFGIDSAVFMKKGEGFPVLYTLFVLGTLVPGLAVLVRRLHDINYSGMHFFVAFVPFVGGLILLIWMLRAGDAGRNSYGPDPLRRKVKKAKKRRPRDEDEDYDQHDDEHRRPLLRNKPKARRDDDEDDEDDEPPRRSAKRRPAAEDDGFEVVDDDPPRKPNRRRLVDED